MDYFKIIGKYYNPADELYNILLSHSNSVARKAVSIAKNNSEFGCDIKFVEEASMIHDIGIFLTYSPSIKCFGKHKYIDHGYLGADLLRKEGFPKHALVCERHTGTGLSLEYIKLKKFDSLPQRDMIPISLEEQIICYADLFFSKTQLDSERSVREVRKKVASWGSNSVNVFERWHRVFS